MGGKESKTFATEENSGSRVSAIAELQVDTLRQIGNLQDPKFGPGKLLVSDELGGLQVAHLIQIIHKSSDNEVKEKKESLSRLAMLRHDSLIRLFKFSVQQKSDFCSTNITTNLYYEYAGYSLEKDFQRRINTGNEIVYFYEESELWHIIFSVISGLAYLSQLGIDHNDIQPSSILLNPAGQVKLLASPITKQPTNLQQALWNSSNHKYLSPKIQKYLRANQLAVHDPAKSDAFSLGVVILEAALLQSADDIYDFNEFTINENSLAQRLDQVGLRYSQNFCSYLRLLLELNEEQRYSIDNFFQIIEQQRFEGVYAADHINIIDNVVEVNQPATESQLLQLQQVQQSQQKNEILVRSMNLDRSANSPGLSMIVAPATEQVEFVKRAAAPAVQRKQQENPITATFAPNTIREEKVRRSKWTLQENNDNNIYVQSYPTTTYNANYTSPTSTYLGTAGLGTTPVASTLSGNISPSFGTYPYSSYGTTNVGGFTSALSAVNATSKPYTSPSLQQQNYEYIPQLDSKNDYLSTINRTLPQQQERPTSYLQPTTSLTSNYAQTIQKNDQNNMNNGNIDYINDILNRHQSKASGAQNLSSNNNQFTSVY